MYAVVNIKGFQYMLEKGDTLRVPKFDIEVGKKIKLSEVLLVAGGKKNHIGQPYIDGAVVEATVVSHDKYDKIVVFKKRRRKDSSVKKGHRQDFTEISIDTIKLKKKRAKKDAEKAPEAAEAVVETPEKIEAVENAPEKAKKVVKKSKTAKKVVDMPDVSEKPEKAEKTEKAKTAKTVDAAETTKAKTKSDKSGEQPEVSDDEQ